MARLADLVMDLMSTSEAWLLQLVVDANVQLVLEGRVKEASAVSVEVLKTDDIVDLAVVQTAMVQSGRCDTSLHYLLYVIL